MKKIYILMAIFHFGIYSLFAQQIPFQGKLKENGAPVTGSRTFELSINQGNINWSETQANIPVVNGLYNLILGSVTALPKNLFNDSNSITLSVAVGGQALSDVIIYVPFGVRWKADGASGIYFGEGDVGIGTATPQNRLHIKGEGNLMSLEGTDQAYLEFYPDGYAAGRKGFLGYKSETSDILEIKNEVSRLQFKTSNSVLTIANNNRVGIGFVSPRYGLEVNGGIRIGTTTEEHSGAIRFDEGDFEGYDGSNWVSFTNATNNSETFLVGSTSSNIVTSVEQLVSSGSIARNSIWQSFSLAKTAELNSIEVEFANVSGSDIRFRLYLGEGTSQQSLFEQTYSSAVYNSTLDLKSFDLSSLNITLQAGQNYTFQVEGIGDDLTFRENTNNPYTFGRISYNSSTDAIFKINVEEVDDYNLNVGADKTIVGTDLEVQGRVKDATGLIMPVGTILPYGGAAVPEGWLVCDGGTVRRDVYADLFTAIGTNWGQGDASTTFNLPDLRGQFLRGLSGSSSDDPDRNSRNAKYSGGNTGNNVGSYQSFTTAKPTNSFTGLTTSDGEHSHTITVFEDEPYGSFRDGLFFLGTQILDGGRGSSNGGVDTESSKSGMHSHSLTITAGGDSETRPKNAYVNYIIKY